jgi:hypothetical protein
MNAIQRLLSLPLLCLFFSSFGQNSELGVEWAHSLGSSRWEVTTSLTPDHAGNIINVGFFSDTVDFDPGPGVWNLISNGSSNTTLHGNVQGFIQKLDSDGNLVWATKYVEGELAPCCVTHRQTYVHVGPDNSFVILSEGNENTDFDPGPGVINFSGLQHQWVMQKFDANGAFQWARHTNLTDNTGEATAIAMDANGDVYLGGTYDGTWCTNPYGWCNSIGVHNSPGDVPFVGKYSGATGQNIWLRTFESSTVTVVTEDSDILDIEIDHATGDILVGGWYVGDLQPEPGVFWYHNGANGVPGDGDEIKAGFLLRLDESTGTSISSQEFYDTVYQWNDQLIQDIGSDAAGNTYAVGRYVTGSSVTRHIKILDSTGTEIFAVYEGAYDDSFRNNMLHVQPDGSFLFNTRFYDHLESPNAYWVNGHIARKYGTDWTEEMHVAIDGPFLIYSQHRAYAALSSDGEIYFAGGYHDGDYDADASPYSEYILPLTGCSHVVCMDAFIQKVAPCPASNSSEDIELCAGEDYTFPDGTVMTDIQEDVTYVSTVDTGENCDDTITTNITVYPNYSFSEDHWVCAGTLYEFSDGSSQVINAAVTFNDGMTSIHGCDSSLTTNVHVEISPLLSAAYDCDNDQLIIEVLEQGTVDGLPAPAWDLEIQPWGLPLWEEDFEVSTVGTYYWDDFGNVNSDQPYILQTNNDPTGCLTVGAYYAYPECYEPICNEAAIQILPNGNFDDSPNTVWVESATLLDGVTPTGFPILGSTFTYGHSAGAAWFHGVPSGSINSLTQDIVIPVSAEPTEMSWWQAMESFQCITAGFEVFVDGNMIYQELADDDPFCGDGWRFRTLDLTPYADGNSHELKLQFSQTGSDHFHLDNVAIYSCTSITGCTDTAACNYNSAAVNEDGSCTYPGCSDPIAMNYDPSAGCPDDSCAYSVCEDFESYQNGDPIAETSALWNTWAELTSGTTAPFADDADVTDILSHSGSNALRFGGAVNGGPQDVVLPFGAEAPYSTGVFEFSAMFHVVPATGGYFNLQAESTPGVTWALDVYMQSNGALILEDTGAGITHLSAFYPQGQWFELMLVCDLGSNNWELFIDGSSLGEFANAKSIASLDLFPLNGHQFYIDDICWSHNVVTGCMDSTACNYNSEAIADDGSCTYGSCPGCTDSAASNYNQNATVEDGSCYYFFLDTNGVTIKCINCVAGDTGEVNGTIYTAVDNSTLPGIVADGSIPLDQVCTTLMTTTQDLFWGMGSMNEDLSSWDMSNVTNTAGMFNGATSFNQPIGAWDMSNVNDAYFMFYAASNFNSAIGQWDVGQVTHMQYMFEGAVSFNQPLNDWDVSSVQNMQSLFAVATVFNQPLDQWDVSSATNMTYMFWSAGSFNQDISNWCVSQIPVEPPLYASGSPLELQHYPLWGTCANPCAGCYNVTFRLDLSEAPAEIINPEVNGFFNDWCGNCNPLTDIDGDDIWETTLQLTAGEHIWKFSSNNWQNQEFPVNQFEAPCFIWDGFGFVNRSVTIAGDTVLPVYCWESCNACGVEDEIVDVWVCPSQNYTFPDGSVAINIEADTTQFSFNQPDGNYLITNLFVETLLELTTSYDCLNDQLVVEILDMGGFEGGASPAWDFSANDQTFSVTSPGTFIVPGVSPDQTWRLFMFETNNCAPDYMVFPDCIAPPCEGATEQVTNGDFDNLVDQVWVETATFLDGTTDTGYGVLSSAFTFDSSPVAAWFGGWNQGSINTMEQDVYIPSSTDPINLTWWQWQDGGCQADDVFTITLAGQEIFSQTGAEDPNCGVWGWHLYTVDISAFATGITQHLEMNYIQNGTNGYTNLFVENVSILSCPCQPDLTQQTVQVCPGDSYTFPDGTVIENIIEGFVQYSYSSPPPCLVGIETTVEVGQHSQLQFYTAPVCHGDDYTYLDGTVINNVMGPVGSYLNILVNASGCDSAIVETALYQPLIEVTVQDTICYIGSYTFPDGFYDDAIFTSMEYVSTLTSVLTGCDSIVTTDLHVRPANPGPVTFNDVCNGGSFTFADGTTQDNLTEGFAYQTFDFDIYGCDSITLEFIQILPAFESSENVDVCEGGSFSFPDGVFVDNITEAFIHTSIFQTDLGCDSLIHTTINVVSGGCMDPSFCNYDPAAICDDDSCCSCAADFNADGETNTLDMLVLLAQFGCQVSCTADINNDLAVNSLDILLFLSLFGSVCEGI